MLKLINITKKFNQATVNEKQVLNNFNLTLKDGDFITIIGGNGSGKSTLMNLISGTISADNGEILLESEDITKQPEYKRAKKLGRVFQDPLLGTAADMTIEENLSIALKRGEGRSLRMGISKAQRELLRETVSQLGLGLEARLHSKVGLLSGGQRQALTLLMATIKKPQLLLLDEHTAALDPKTAKLVLDLTSKLVATQKITTMMITHNMKDAIRLGNRLIMMYNGEIIYDVSGEEKAALKTADLLEKFTVASLGSFANDRLILSN